MLTQSEMNKLRLIKQAVQQGRGREVSRADKQWVLDIAAREGDAQDPRVMLAAAREGFDITRCTVQKTTVAA